MKRFVPAILSGISLIAIASVAVAQLVPTVATVTAFTPTSDLVQVVPGGVPTGAAKYATARALAQVGAALYTSTASVATGVATTEQTLGTYSLPANWLNYNGRKLVIRASFSAAANGNNKTFKCYFGSSVISSGVLTTNAKNGSCEVYVTRTGGSTQIVYGNMLVDTTAITGYVNLSSTETDTAAVTIKFTGTDGSASAADIVMNDFSVVALN